MEEIKKELGYRFVLLDGTYTDEAQAGQTISIDINLENVGYAAPFNPRAVELILRHNTLGDLYFASLSNDPRFWLPGVHNISATWCLPLGMASGDYELLLHLADPEPSLYNRPEYAIQLANTNVWEASTGYNKLCLLYTSPSPRDS